MILDKFNRFNVKNKNLNNDQEKIYTGNLGKDNRNMNEFKYLINNITYLTCAWYTFSHSPVKLFILVITTNII